MDYPLWENLNFWTFESSCFYSLQSFFFFVLEYRKTRFLPYISKRKKPGKIANFLQNHGLTPLEKSQFFDFSNFLFL